MASDYNYTVRYDFGALRLHRNSTTEGIVRAVNDLPLELGGIGATQDCSVEVGIDGFKDPVSCVECDEIGQVYYENEWFCREHNLRQKYANKGIEGDLLDEMVERDL